VRYLFCLTPKLPHILPAAANIIAHHNFVLDDLDAGDHVIRVKPVDEIVF